MGDIHLTAVAAKAIVSLGIGLRSSGSSENVSAMEGDPRFDWNIAWIISSLIAGFANGTLGVSGSH